MFTPRPAMPLHTGHTASTTPSQGVGTLAGALANVPPDPLVMTKLMMPPPRTMLVPRPRLIDRLEAGLQGKLTLIIAPAGYGKTTLVSAWHAAEAGHAWPLAWLSLDPNDNDPVRFWTYVISALQTALPGLGSDALALLQSARPSSFAAVLTALINALALIPNPVVLVLDDYHAITAPAIHESLAFLLEHQPARLRLVITTRVEPPLPLMRLRARSEVSDLRAADLSFTNDEVEAFLNRLLDLNLSEQDVAALATRTEGWIAGLVLAAHALHGHADAAAFISAISGSQRFILDYLVEDVLQQQPIHIRRFLLDTSVLDGLTASLCDALLLGDAVPADAAYSQLVLDELERKNLFLVPLDDQRRWYRYHHLFGEMLRSRAQQLQPERIAVLHRRASAWYVQRGLLHDAVKHALAAGDMEQAANLIEQGAERTLLRGEVTTLLGWLGALPPAMVQARPWLRLAHAWALGFTGQVDAAAAQLLGADAQASAAESTPHGSAAAFQALVAGQRGDVAGLIARAQDAVAFDAAHGGVPQSLSLLALGNAHFFTGDLAATRETLAQVIAAHQASGDLLSSMLAIYILADVELHQGHVRQAAELLQQGIQMGSGPDGQPLPIAGLAYSGLGNILREQNQLDMALHSLRRGSALAAQWGIQVTLVDGVIALARLHQANGDVEIGLQALAELEASMWAAWATPWQRAQLAACRARLWLAQGQLGPARQWAQNYAQYVEAAGPNLRPLIKYCFAHMTLARVRLAEAQPEEAAQVLTPLLDVAEAGGWAGDLIELLILQALALHMQAATAHALATLRRALTLAEPAGYVRIFVDEGPPMARLLAQCAASLLQGDPILTYTERLLRVFPEALSQPPIAPGSSQKAASPLAEPLSERELEVLRLLAAGLESPEIARNLIISVSTVRTHIKNIYGKLDVHSRVQAVERARALGLLR